MTEADREGEQSSNWVVFQKYLTLHYKFFCRNLRQWWLIVSAYIFFRS